MAIFSDQPIRMLGDLGRFEAAMPQDQRLRERSVLDVFTRHARRRSAEGPHGSPGRC